MPSTLSRNPLTGLNLLQHNPKEAVEAFVKSRNPLTGLNLLQLYPYLFPVLDGARGGGVCEKDETWNMRRWKNGGFGGFGPMESLWRKGGRECISEYRRPEQEKLAFKLPSRLPGTRPL